MRIVFFTWPARLQRFLDVVTILAERGHEIVVAVPSDRAGDLPGPLRSLANVRVELYDEAADAEHGRGRTVLRLLRDYAWYQTPAHAENTFNRRRALDFLILEFSRGRRGVAAAWPGSLPLSGEEAQAAVDDLGAVEAQLPPDPGVLDFLRRQRADVVLVTPLILAGSRQVDVLKAARALGVPSALLVYSWDNLSNKGLIHVAPDRVYVWNEVQRREAVELHAVAEEDVVATGAPRWDSFFERRPSSSREAFLHAHGLDPDRPLVLYLGSSSAICPDETLVVERWLDVVRRSDGALREANVLVRPHPREAVMWSGWASDDPRVAFVRQPRQADQELFDQLTHADVAVGLNTSAQIEAAIVGTPIFTFRAGERLAPGQEGSLHFRYLLGDGGGSVTFAHDLDEHAAQLERALAGDVDTAAISGFVQAFVRPHGLDRPASPILADEIVTLAARRTA
jgi:hypothetical protein